jgi:small subunit ribosomal protein S6e
MKLNVANPSKGTQRTIQVDKMSEMRLYDKKIGSIIEGELIGPEYSGYVFKVTGGDDLQGFPMKNGVLTNKRVRLLLKKGDKGYKCERDGVRRRKSVRGCIISSETAVLSMIILTEGTNPIEGLTDRIENLSHLPKRATKLRRMFNIPKGSDVVSAVKNIIGKPRDENGEKRKIPRLRVRRIPTQTRIDRKRIRNEKMAEKKEISLKKRKEYLEKYFNAENI